MNAPPILATVAELRAAIKARDEVLIGLISIILGKRSADDLRSTLAEVDKVITGLSKDHLG